MSQPDSFLHIDLLGGFRVQVGNRPIPDAAWRLRKAAALLKILALAPSHQLHREQVLDLLWPDLDGKAASNNLHHVLHVARRTLWPESRSPFLQLRNDLLILSASDDIKIDVGAFEAAAMEARHTNNLAAYQHAVSLYSGDLLPEDLYEDWAVDRRESARSLFLALLLDLARLAEQAGQIAQSIHALQRAIEHDRTCEDAHRSLMRLYAQSGQRHQALRQYRLLEGILRDDLAVEPDDATAQLFGEITEGTVQLAVPLSPLVGGTQRNDNLPAALTSFIGREREVAELGQIVETRRLVTVIGAGGSGKTRLVLEAAGTLTDRFADGVWLIELASLTEGDLLPKAVATVLDIAEIAGTPLQATLAAALQNRRLLLVLDNCEHLIDACAHLAGELLASCHGLHILASSREPLNVQGELLMRIVPLSLPDQTRTGNESHASTDRLLGSESVRLFVERAQYRQPGFLLNDDNAAAVVRICRSLEGLPLAIELAAARIGTLSPDQIAGRLHDALSLLTTGGRTAQSRQRTLRGTLDWSYELLSDWERTLFRRLSAFAGGWTLEAAEAANHDVPDVLDVLSHLVDKSLVVAETSPHEPLRYRFLEPVRQYAREQLVESSEAEATQRSHAQWFLALAQEARQAGMTPDEPLAFQQLDREHDNLRAAIRASLDSGDAQTAAALVTALWYFWQARGNLAEAVRLIDETLAYRDVVPPAQRAGLLYAAARMSHTYAERSVPLYEASLELYRALDDQRGVANVLYALGWLHKVWGNSARAAVIFDESRTLYETIGARSNVAYAMHGRAEVALNDGDLDLGERLYSEALAIKQELGLVAKTTPELIGLGWIAVQRADYQRAEALLHEALALSRQLGDSVDVNQSLGYIGYLQLVQGNYQAARTAFEEARTAAEDSGLEMIVGYELLGLGMVACLEGNFGDALPSLSRALSIFVEFNLPFHAIEALEGVMVVAWSLGSREHGATVFGSVETQRDALHYPRCSVDAVMIGPTLRALREAMVSDPELRAAFVRGQKMTDAEATAYVLGLTFPSGPETPLSSPDVSVFPALTPRENQIATLVGGGMTNRQIAQSLSIRERTVDTHVSNILGKLALRSRTEIVRYQAPREEVSELPPRSF